MAEEDSIFGAGPERLKRLVDFSLDADEQAPSAKQGITSASFGDLPLSTGTRIGSFKIERELGRGGAGIVYLAHDAKLDRKVAIKSLPPDLVGDEKMRSRFKREARALASVNHPNIATIHEVLEEDPQRHYLVLEYVPGQTLAERIAGGPMTLRETLDIGTQVAEAVAAAHEKGVIHRDLKPGNIKITPEGQVKVLDFGLAKAMGDKVLDGHHTLTQPGRVMGTPAYMSPEQASGQGVDQRTDTWAFGCCLFEMLSSHRPFRGGTMTDLMTAVLTVDLDWTLLAEETPPEMVTLLQRCLEKEARRRFQSMMDLAFVLRNMSGAGMATASFQRSGHNATGHRLDFKNMLPWGLTGVTVIVALFAILHSRRVASVSGPGLNVTPRRIELHLPTPATQGGTDREIRTMALSPDGRKFVYVDPRGLWLRWLDRAGPSVLLVPEEVRGPFWSPQSTEVAYFQGRNLLRLAIVGGKPNLICRAPEAVWAVGTGGTWFSDGHIVFALGNTDLYQVSARGGEATLALARREDESGLWFANPLPEGRGVLLSVHGETGADTIHVWTADGERKLLMEMPETYIGNPVYSPSGHVLFGCWGKASGIWAFPFSLSRLERTGDLILVSEQGLDPSTSEDGALLINLTSEALGQLVWVDRNGEIIQEIGPPERGMAGPRLSHDDRRIAWSRLQNRNWDIWVTDAARGIASVAVSSHGYDIAPFWFPDGKTIAFRRWTDGMPQVLVKQLDGSGSEQTFVEGFMDHISPSGKYLTLRATLGSELAHISLEGADRTRIPFPKEVEDMDPWTLRLSPDDRLLAFRSAATDRTEVYLAEFPSCENRKLVSQGAGVTLEWHPDGSQLFYLGADNRSIWSVAVRLEDSLSVGDPNKVLDLPDDVDASFQVSADGQRFLMMRNIPDALGPDGLPMAKALLMENWYEDFRQRQRQ